MNNSINTTDCEEIPIAVAHIVEESAIVFTQHNTGCKSTEQREISGNDAINRRISALLEKISNKEQEIANLRENALSTRRIFVTNVSEAIMTE